MSSGVSEFRKARQSPLGSLAEDARLSSNAASLRKQIALGGNSNGSTRHSVRHTGATNRYSRGSIRNSMRVPGQSSMSGTSVMGVLEKLQVIDADGKDRTPKPLLARAHMHASAADSSVCASEAPESVSIIERQFQQPAARLVSSVSFKFAENTVGAHHNPDGASPQIPLPYAISSSSKITNSESGAKYEATKTTAMPMLMPRSKATQLSSATLASKGCQVVPWELALQSSQQDSHQHGQQPPAPTLLKRNTTASQDAVGAEGPEDPEAALLGALDDCPELEQAGGGGHRRQSPLDTSFGMGGSSSRRSSSTQDASSRRTTATSHLTGEPSDRGCLMSRTSMATYMQDGGSFLGHSGASAGSRSSLMPGLRQGGANTLSPSEAAAEAARRQKAEAQRALDRLPRIQASMEHLEKALVQNAYHPVMAASKGMSMATSQPPAGDSLAPVNEAAHPAISGTAAAILQDPCGIEDRNSVGSLHSALAEDAGGRAAAPSGAATAGKVAARAGVAADGKAELQQLWQWRLPGSGDGGEDLPVSCIAWNKVLPDLVAVGYGELDYSVSARGQVAFFSLRNPGNPVWQLHTLCGVSSLDFSARTGSVLAVGMYDGSIAVYDVRGRRDEALARVPPTGPHGQGGHAEPVWSIRYVAGAGEAEERLVSISTDGRVLAWKHTQSLDHVDLMRLKRAATRRRMPHGHPEGAATTSAGIAAEQQTEGLLGWHAGGTCFDFSPADPRTYLVGTEEGVVHKCSTTFTEQSTQTYQGHSAPVYQVCWCPFLPTTFLTCSADWTLRLWAEAHSTPLWTFQPGSAKSEVADVQWCPSNSTVFAAAAGNTLQLWDMEHSVLKPQASVTRYGVKLTCLAFCPTSPVLLCGADNGTVTAYSMASMYREREAREGEAKRLEAVLQASVYRHVA